MSAITSSTVDDVVRRSARRHPDRVALRLRRPHVDLRGTRRRGLPRGRGTCSTSDSPRATGSAPRGRTPTPTCSPSSAAPAPGSSTCRSTTRSPATSWPTCSPSPAAGSPSSTRRCATPSRRSARDTELEQVLPCAAATTRSLPTRGATGDGARRSTSRRRRHRPGPAALHLGHDVAAQGRDDDPPRAGARVRLVRRTRSTCAEDAPRCTRCRSTTRRRCTCSCCPTSRSARRTTSWPGPTCRRSSADRGRPASAPLPPAHRVGAAGQPPRLRHPRPRPRCARRTTARRSCRCRCWSGCGARCPGSAFYNCFGQSEIGPLATVLRPEEHDERPDSCGRAGAVRRGAGGRRRGQRRRGRTSPARSSTARRSCARATGTSPRRRPRPSATAGSTPATWSRRDEDGYFTVVDRIKDVINTGGVLVASPRGRGRALHPPRRRPRSR